MGGGHYMPPLQTVWFSDPPPVRVLRPSRADVWIPIYCRPWMKSSGLKIKHVLTWITMVSIASRYGHFTSRLSELQANFKVGPFNPRPAGGRLNAPSGFSRVAKIWRRAAPPGFHPPYPSSFPQLLWKFRPCEVHVMRHIRPCEVPCEARSPGQVKWPNYKITFQSRHGCNVSGKVMKLSEYDELISAYKTCISDFWYRWPQARLFLRPPHYKSMGKNSTPLYLLWRNPIWVE